MSFGGGGGAENTVPAFKKFISEDELQEKRQKRQEEWEKVRTPDQPLEAPEEEFDPRSLYDQLQEQKQRKQDEYEEQFKLKNQVKGLEDDEVEFLDYVSERQEELDKKRQEEDSAVLNEYKNAVTSQIVDKTSAKTGEKKIRTTSVISHTKKSQQALLAGAVKRKSSSSETDNTDKKRKGEDTDGDTRNAGSSNPSQCDDTTPGGAAGQVIGILPGLGAYTDTSDSNTSSSDSEIDTDIFRKAVKVQIVEHQH